IPPVARSRRFMAQSDFIGDPHAVTRWISRPESSALPLAARGGPAAQSHLRAAAPVTRAQKHSRLKLDWGVCPRTGPPPGNASASGLSPVQLPPIKPQRRGLPPGGGDE